MTDVTSRTATTAHLSRERIWNIAREAGIIATAVFLYFYVRGLVDAKRDVAIAHSHDIVDVEKALGIFHEPGLQGFFTGHEWVVEIINSVYIYGHWPIVVGTLIWLVWKHPGEYSRFRNALLISGGIGLIVFATFPVAPPRFLPEYGFWDSVTAESNAYRVLQPPALTNPYAAMPSLHFGWNLLMGIAWIRLARLPIGKIFGWVMPPLMFAAIVLTANHYFLDGIAGGTLATLSLLVSSHLHYRNRQPVPASERDASVAHASPDLRDAPAPPAVHSTAAHTHRAYPSQETHGAAAPQPSPTSAARDRASRGQ